MHANTCGRTVKTAEPRLNVWARALSVSSNKLTLPLTQLAGLSLFFSSELTLPLTQLAYKLTLPLTQLMGLLCFFKQVKLPLTQPAGLSLFPQTSNTSFDTAGWSSLFLQTC